MMQPHKYKIFQLKDVAHNMYDTLKSLKSFILLRKLKKLSQKFLMNISTPQFKHITF